MPPARCIAFTATTSWDTITSRPLREATLLLTHLVIRRVFTVPRTLAALTMASADVVERSERRKGR